MQKSAEHLKPSPLKENKTSLLVYPFILLIQIYRYTLSPIFGQGCRFEPSCSHYAEEALKKYGLFRGSVMAGRRLLRCHPWHEGGYDPVQ